MVFKVTQGEILSGENVVGAVEGRLVMPVRAIYRPNPPPGQYLYTPPEPGSLPDQVYLETMGYFDLDAALRDVDVPEAWTFVPAELTADLTLRARLRLDSVDADEEYRANEPEDLVDAADRFAGEWVLTIPLELGVSVPREPSRVDLDRWDFELDARFAIFERAG